MQSSSAAIETRELTKQFGKFTAVDHVNFEVGKGELFGLLGPNGAGKTTLIRMLTTLLTPTSGAAFVAGHNVIAAPKKVRESIGVVPQALTSDLELTAWQNLDIYGEFYGLGRAARHARAQHLLEMVGLRERAHDMVATYSGGMRRRLEIARGLIQSPQVLFLDEPTIGLDPQARRAVWDLLEQLRTESDLTISLTTHYMDEAEKLCDRIAIIDGGKIVAMGTTQELKAMVKGSDRLRLEIAGDAQRAVAALRDQPYVQEITQDSDSALVISTADGAHAMPKVIERLESVDAKINSMSIERISLEDVFIRFTGRRLREEGGGPAAPIRDPLFAASQQRRF
ncbi:MAG TPA: ATP-binding cassette domain-containing protein [Candidatus Binataceae bacterium]|nr:ATP-binding cassette domain-containing protein [Candidatus Binataceae bacterium]